MIIIIIPTRLYDCQKKHTDVMGEVTCRLCNKAPESVAHVLACCTALAQNKYITRHNNAALKILFFEILQDLGLVRDSVPPQYPPLKPKPVYEANDAQVFWDVPLFAEHQEVEANRVHARIIKHELKQVTTLEMSCSWVTSREKKEEEKTTQYEPLRWDWS